MVIPMKKKQTRSQARTEAFKLIFQCGVNDEDIDFLIEQALAETPESEQNINYITTVVKGVAEKNDELCADISANLGRGWRIDRISRVSLAVLKLAIFEIKYLEDVPPKAAINEAVELDKLFDEPENSAFVNGVLGSFCRKL